jgi:M6 family metalloprotease-like protein
MKRIIKVLLTSSAVVITALLITIIASAAPAYEIDQTITQPSGESFTACQKGDELFNYLVTDSGAVIIQEPDGYWYYTVPDGMSGLSSSGKYAIDVKPDQAVTGSDMPASRALQNSQPQVDSLRSSPLSVNAVTSEAGSQRILVLLVSFTSTPIANSDSAWSNAFFGTYGKTVRTYYQEVSAGKLDFTPASESYGLADDGVVAVTLPYIHPDTKNIVNARNMAIVRDALTAADAYVDFSGFDENKDGFISSSELHIITVVAGYERSFSAASPSIWAHHAALSDSDTPPVLDGTGLCSGANNGQYIQIGERNGDHMATIGTICHELGNDLGLPDLYDTVDHNGKSEGVGVFSLMGYGNWCCDYTLGEQPGATPSHLDAWSKIRLGFVTPTVAGNGSFLAYSGYGADNVLMFSTADPEEYFLVENRSFYGFDTGLNGFADHGGIAVWHIDERVINANLTGNTVNGDAAHKGVDLEEANFISYGGNQLDDNNAQQKPYNCLFGLDSLFSPDTAPSSNMFSGVPSGIRIVFSCGYQYAVYVNSGPIDAIGPIRGSTSIFNSAAEALSVGQLNLFGATAAYQWQRSGSPGGPWEDIEAANESSIRYLPTVADVGKYLRVVATGCGLYTGTASSPPVGPVTMRGIGVTLDCGPANLDTQVLTARTHPPEATVAYQWFRAPASTSSQSAIAGATGKTYTLTADDEGKYICVRVCRVGFYTGEGFSSLVGPLKPNKLASVDVDGANSPVTGFTLTSGAVKTFSGATVVLVGYQWKSADRADGTYTNIPGATKKSYMIRTEDAGKYIKLEVSTNTSGYYGTAASKAIGPIKVSLTGLGAICGTLQVGSTLTAGDPEPIGATVSYSWWRMDSKNMSGYTQISGAKERTYTLTGADSGKYIQVYVYGTGDYQGVWTSPISGPVTSQENVIRGIGTTSGTLKVGSTLTAGPVVPSDATFSYQWMRASSPTGIYSSIEGQTGSTYALTVSDVGTYIRVTVTGTGSYSGSARSVPVGPVNAITGITNISGTAQVGSTLTAGAIVPENATVSYQWQYYIHSSDIGIDITGATDSTYTLTPNDAGKLLRVIARGTGEFCGTATSNYIGPISMVLTHIGPPEGQACIGSTLTVNILSTATALYQWQRADTPDGIYTDILAADVRTYIPTPADFGKYIRVSINSFGSITCNTASDPVGPITYSSGLTVSGIGLSRNTASGTVSVTLLAYNSLDAPQSADFILAVYDASGKMLTVHVISGVTIDSLGMYTYAATIAYGNNPDIITVKVYSLKHNSALHPIVSPWSGSTA